MYMYERVLKVITYVVLMNTFPWNVIVTSGTDKKRCEIETMYNGP